MTSSPSLPKCADSGEVGFGFDQSTFGGLRRRVERHSQPRIPQPTINNGSGRLIEQSPRSLHARCCGFVGPHAFLAGTLVREGSAKKFSETSKFLKVGKHRIGRIRLLVGGRLPAKKEGFTGRVPQVFTLALIRVSTALSKPCSRTIAYACLKERVAYSCPSGPCLLETVVDHPLRQPTGRAGQGLAGGASALHEFVPEGERHAQALALAVHRGRVVTHFDVAILAGHRPEREGRDLLS